jgi:hypothetical protein
LVEKVLGFGRIGEEGVEEGGRERMKTGEKREKERVARVWSVADGRRVVE